MSRELQRKKLATFMGIFFILLAPLEVTHGLMWIVIHIYELLEFLLDELVHHFFETSHHTTQVIVFYLMLMLFTCIFYRLWRWTTVILRVAKISFPNWWQSKKKDAVEAWSSLPLTKRAQLIGGFLFSSSLVSMLIF
ncbi:hypothetical protein GO003_008880 [Methylicorpusculum oleiharenae]|uniref:hypothetical protein n=1 Tax=Methylicorpusculum oleiharenae TaxID=1338687 RepID=UPI00135C371B|nr:hypothetical protein [Methylicorpusculum oleiharenae]MCD2450501.1 hypothetical protein [Methylicorpusculum oleiharenae]